MAAPSIYPDNRAVMFKPVLEPQTDSRDTGSPWCFVRWVCKELLETLKQQHLVLNCCSTQRNRARIRQVIEVKLDKLPESHDESTSSDNCDQAYRHVYDSYLGDRNSVYGQSAV